MQFLLLGPLEVLNGDEVLRLRAQKERSVLAVLLLHRNEVVSVDRLIEEVWGADRPGTAANTLQAYVSRLRKSLGKDRILTRPPGYAILVEPDELDITRFEALAAAGRAALQSNPSAAARTLGEALDLWRGDAALSEFSFAPFARAQISRLDEARLAVLEDKIDAELMLGRHADLVGDLDSLISQHPLRERLRAQLMLALYRSGRQAEALGAYRTARHLLVGELGIDPSPLLQRLHTSILSQDPGLDLPNSSSAQPNPPHSLEAAGLPVRKPVTVVFIETSLSERHDPEVRAELSARVLEVLSSTMTRHGGLLVPRTGDASIATFGLPTIHEDDALRAARAAIETHSQLRTLSSRLWAEWKTQLRVRLGITTADALALEDQLLDLSPLDDAAKLKDLAKYGEVVLGDNTRRLIGTAAHAEPLSGNCGWRLLALRHHTPAFPEEFSGSLLGREAELSHLLQAFSGVTSKNTCHLFTVLGAAGIGKSRLAQELAVRLAPTATVLKGRCLSYGEATALWPLMQIVRQAAGETTQDAIQAALSGEHDAALIAERVAGSLGKTQDLLPVGEDTFWALRRLLECFARKRPLLIILEDLHWAGPTLLDFVEHIADWSRGSPIFILCLARHELLETRPSWSGGKYNITCIGLGRLPERASEALVRRLAHGTAISAIDQQRVCELAEGNPLFIEQLLAYVGERPPHTESATPPTIQALLAARLDQLGMDQKAVVRAASVVGKEFSLTAVAEMLPSFSADRIAYQLRDLVRKELIQCCPPTLAGSESFRFQHILIRDIAYESVPKDSRAKLHEALADWLDAEFAQRPVEIEEIAGYHLEAAYECSRAIAPKSPKTEALARRACEKLAAAGRRALQRSDIPAAVALLSRAVDLLSDEAHGGETLLALAFAYRERGDWNEAEELLMRARAVAIAADDTALKIHLNVAQLQHRLFVEPELTTETIIREGSEALTALTRLKCHRYAAGARTTLAWAHLLRGEAKEAETLLLEIIRYARRKGNTVVLNDSRKILLAAWLYGPTHVAEAAISCQEVLAEQPPLRVAASGFRYLALLRAMNCEFAEAYRLLARDSAILDELGLAVVAAAAREVHGIVALLSDDPVAAENSLRLGLTTLRTLRERMYIAGVAAVLAQALYAQGRHDEAYDMTVFSESGGVRDVAAPVHWRSTRAKILAGRGEEEEAERLGLEAVALANKTDFLDLRGEAAMDLAEVLRLVGKPSEAVRHVESALALFEQKGNIVSAAKANAVLSREGEELASHH